MDGPWEKYKSQSGPWEKYQPAPTEQKSGLAQPWLSPEQQIPGVMPYDQEKAVWDQAQKEGLDYFEAKKRVVDARKKYSQSRPEGGLSENLQAVNAMGALAMSPAAEVKKGIESAGESVQKAYPGMTGSLIGGALKLGSAAIPSTPAQLAGSAAVDVGAPVVLDAAREPAKKVVGWFAQKGGGIASDTLKLLEDRAPEVVQYARKGYETATKAANDAGKNIQTAIEQYANKAGQEYRAAIDDIVKKNPQYNNIRIDLDRLMGKTVDRIRDDFGFAETGTIVKGHHGSYELPGTRRLPNLNLIDSSGNPIQAAQGAITRIGKSESDTVLFNDFASQIKNAQTPSQVYYLQKDLSDAIKSNQGKPIAAALKQLKGEVVGAFDSSVSGTPLAEVNKNYRAAMTLGEELSRVENSDAPFTTIKSAFNRDTNTADALRDLFNKSPQAKSEWEKAQVADAGAKISAWSRGINPNTGASVLPALGVGAAAKMMGANPVGALGLAAGEFAATSPRLYGEAFNVLSKTPGGLATRVPSQAALAALRAARNDNGQ